MSLFMVTLFIGQPLTCQLLLKGDISPLIGELFFVQLHGTYGDGETNLFLTILILRLLIQLDL